MKTISPYAMIESIVKAMSPEVCHHVASVLNEQLQHLTLISECSPDRTDVSEFYFEDHRCPILERERPTFPCPIVLADVQIYVDRAAARPTLCFELNERTFVCLGAHAEYLEVSFPAERGPYWVMVENPVSPTLTVREQILREFGCRELSDKS